MPLQSVDETPDKHPAIVSTEDMVITPAIRRALAKGFWAPLFRARLKHEARLLERGLKRAA